MVGQKQGRWHLAGVILLGTGCSSMDIDDFAGREPAMVPERFFAGELRGWGMEIGVLGGLGRRLQVDASGRFDEATQTLHLDETYRFDDGHVDRLRWQIRKLDDGRYEAVEERALEPGEGESAGSAFRLTYRRAVPQADGSTTTLSFDDWFVQIDEETLMVWASVQKVMLPVGSMSVVYRRVDMATGANR
jgi:hypothetical protein